MPKPKTQEQQAPPGIEAELWVLASPLVKKIALNPEMYFWYDYARGKLGFEGDLGDFLCDCVRFFFKTHGYAISIVQHVEEKFSS